MRPRALRPNRAAAWRPREVRMRNGAASPRRARNLGLIPLRRSVRQHWVLPVSYPAFDPHLRSSTTRCCNFATLHLEHIPERGCSLALLARSCRRAAPLSSPRASSPDILCRTQDRRQEGPSYGHFYPLALRVHRCRRLFCRRCVSTAPRGCTWLGRRFCGPKQRPPPRAAPTAATAAHP